MSIVYDLKKRIRRFFSNSVYNRLIAISVIYIIIISILAIYSHYSFYTNTWDLGIYAQSLYSTINHGKFFYYTAELPGNPSGSFFGIHFSPFMFLLLPIYALFQSPVTLLVLRPIAIASGIIPLYKIMRFKGITDEKIIYALSLLYLIYIPVMFPINNFDLEVFLPTLFLFSTYHIDAENYVKAFIFIILALSVNEFIPIIALSIPFYIILRKRHNIIRDLTGKKISYEIILSLLILITCVVWYNMATMIITSCNPTALTTKWEWGELGNGPKQIAFNLLSNPLLAVKAFMNDWQRKVFYLITLLGPLGFLSLLDPIPLVMTLPWLAASLLSINPQYYYIGSQYPTFVSPFIFYSTIHGIERLKQNTPAVSNKKILGFITTTFIVTTILLIPTISPMFQFVEISHSDVTAHKLLKKIPKDASVSLMPEYFPHKCNRLEVYPYHKPGVEYILINEKSWWYDVELPRPAHTAPKWNEITITSEYKLLFSLNGNKLYKHKSK